MNKFLWLFLSLFIYQSVLSTERDSCGVVAEDSSVIVKHNKKKKTIAAILAFPLPFGILGMHRIFLGTKPYIPFVYIGTAGGCAGILPVADFIAILNADEKTFKKFENNPKVFMWGR